MEGYKGLNILVLTDFLFPDSMGGANKMAFCTSRGLAGRGHHPQLSYRSLPAPVNSGPVRLGTAVDRGLGWALPGVFWILCGGTPGSTQSVMGCIAESVDVIPGTAAHRPWCFRAGNPAGTSPAGARWYAATGWRLTCMPVRSARAAR